MDAARELFDRIVEGGEAFLHQMIKDQQEENLLLDFKEAEKGHGPMTKEDRKTLAEALSGFSNSDGGVIVWGVECRKTRNSPDVAQKCKPIARLKDFTTTLQTNTSACTSPGIIGVEHATIPASDGADTGYVITYIPKGEAEPHMAIGQGQHTYYFRSGSSFLPMEAFMVADRYQRRPQPKLGLTYSFQNGSATGHTDKLWIRVGIRNVGLGVALYPALALRPVNSEGIRFDRSGHLSRISSAGYNPEQSGFKFIAAGADDIIHPGVTLQMARALVHTDLHSKSEDLVFEYDLYCDGFTSHGTLTVLASDISAARREFFGWTE